MRIPRLLFVVGALAVSACGDDGVGPKRGDSTTTELTCAGSGGRTDCTIPLAGKTSFSITVESIGCEAQGNVLRIVSPTAETLSSNACALPSGQKWDFASGGSAPFSAAAVLNLSVTAKFFSDPPSLELTTVEAGTKWRVVFEDGYDADFNDVVLLITST